MDATVAGGAWFIISSEKASIVTAVEEVAAGVLAMCWEQMWVAFHTLVTALVLIISIQNPQLHLAKLSV
jgi:hypothetical protein